LKLALSKPKPAVSGGTPVRTAHMCVLMTVYNCGTVYTIQHLTVLIITFPLILQTITTAQYWRGGVGSLVVYVLFTLVTDFSLLELKNTKITKY